MKPAIHLLSIILLSLLLYSAAPAQQPLHFDFEKMSVEGPLRPWGWAPFRMGPHTTTLLDSTRVFEGRYSLRFFNDDLLDKGNGGEHVLAYWLSPHELTGKKVVLMGTVRTEKSDGFAQVSLSAYGDTGLIREVRSIDFRGTNTWRPLTLEFQTDAPAHSWFLILASNGAGKVWFDDFRLLVDGVEKRSLEVAENISPDQRLWLKKNTSVLSGVHPVSEEGKGDYSDLSVFKKAVGDAKIIALGEATHGTSEFFLLKHRLLQFGVQELNVRAFAIEANQLEVEKINRYVCDGAGSADQVIRGMFRVWNTEEMLALIEWMRAYNLKNPAQKVTFSGFDLQDPSLAMDSISLFLARWDPGLKPLADSLQRQYREAWRAQYYPQAPDSVRMSWKENATKVLALVTANKEQWMNLAATPVEKNSVDWVVQNARVVYQSAVVAFSQDASGRDTFMAENIRWIASRQPLGARVVVWAHDSHIARGGHADMRLNYHNGQCMGKYLSRLYGRDYRAFGLFTGEGQYSATISFSNHQVVPVDAMKAPRGSVDEALHQIAAEAGTNQLFLDLQPALLLKKNEWLTRPRPVRFVGYAASDYDFGAMMSVPHQFDGVFFVDKTNASRMLK